MAEAYVALYSSDPTSYKFFALERTTGRIVWSSQVWAGLFPLFSSGPPSGQVVEIQPAGDKVAVFGLSWGGYIEVFDARTGKSECRFVPAHFPWPEINPSVMLNG